jgi:hypothetical protein
MTVTEVDRPRAQQPTGPGPRRVSGGLLDPRQLLKSTPDALRKLNPATLWRNPVMFIVEVGSVFTTVLAIARPSVFAWAITIWLWLTVIFANLAEAVAEGRGKAQADALRRTKRDTVARRLRDWAPGAAGVAEEQIPAPELRQGDIVVVETGPIIPGDGDVIEGIASVDESAITGESAPVIRESGGDRSAVTGGTKVLSDRIVVRITQKPGESFVDRMIALVEGANRQAYQPGQRRPEDARGDPQPDQSGRIQQDQAGDPRRVAAQRDRRAERMTDQDQAVHGEMGDQLAGPGAVRRDPVPAGAGTGAQARLAGHVGDDDTVPLGQSRGQRQAGGGAEIRAGHEEHPGLARAGGEQVGLARAGSDPLPVMRHRPAVQLVLTPVLNGVTAGRAAVDLCHAADCAASLRPPVPNRVIYLLAHYDRVPASAPRESTRHGPPRPITGRSG